MSIREGQPLRIVFVSAVLLLALSGSAAAALDVALGDTVPLAGSSPSSRQVYLFLTGPNLPVNGVPLNDITKRADEGYFTRVDVDSNDRWSYKWSTATVGGRLDAGTYTVWVVSSPSDRSNLAYADYRTITINLGKPSLMVNTPAQPGSIEVTSAPSGARVLISDTVKGRTPLTISGLDPGSYSLTFLYEGYHNFTTRVPVSAGAVSQVAATLIPVQETPSLNETPAPPPAKEVVVTPETSRPVPATTRAAGLFPALVLAGVVIVALGLFRSR